MDPIKARELAYGQAERVEFQPGENPFQTFSSIKFNFPQGQFVDQLTVARQNQELDPQSCLGRVAVVGAIMEQHHPYESLMFGEVWEDHFRNIMLEKLEQDPRMRGDKSFLQELLMYEEPHAVVCGNGSQFEPLSLDFGEFVEHPRIGKFNFWEAIAASAIVSRAWLEGDTVEKMKLLEKAERLCPGLVLTKENMVYVLEDLGRIPEAVSMARQALEKRPCARTLFVTYLLSRDISLYGIFAEQYGEEFIDIILEESHVQEG